MEMVIAIAAGVVVLFIIAVYVLSVYYNKQLVTEVYFLGGETGKTQQMPVKIIFLSDIHDSLFGKRLEFLLETLEREKPDLILIGGDVVVRKKFRPDRSLELLRKIAQYGQVYYANGNHEMKLALAMPEEMAQYDRKLEEYGVHRLVNESAAVCIKGSTVRITGLDLPEQFYRKLKKPDELTKEKLEELVGEKKEDYTILLAHHPRYFQAYAEWGANLVLSGHIHGGMIRLPKLGGVLSPDLSLFPKYSGGMYQKKDSVLIVSRGVGVHSIPFRLFNKPELSIILKTDNEAPL